MRDQVRAGPHPQTGALLDLSRTSSGSSARQSRKVLTEAPWLTRLLAAGEPKFYFLPVVLGGVDDTDPAGRRHPLLSSPLDPALRGMSSGSRAGSLSREYFGRFRNSDGRRPGWSPRRRTQSYLDEAEEDSDSFDGDNLDGVHDDDGSWESLYEDNPGQVSVECRP